jgi:hypothetical protein
MANSMRAAVVHAVTSVDIEVTACPSFPSTSRVFADCDCVTVWDGLSKRRVVVL